MDIELLKKLSQNPNITIISLSVPHQKASERYVEVSFYDVESQFIWKGLVPYFYRRTGLFLETEHELASHLENISLYFTKKEIENWTKQEKQLWQTEWARKEVTKGFFDVLISMKCTSDFPPNDNPQRRIQDIKELGYTISSRRTGKKMERLLLPIPRGLQTGYETLSRNFRNKALKTLEYLNAFELSNANKAGLLPDHKFPEIRWDAETKAENPEDMSDEDIKNKFQLLDNQRNQQKREICRNCFQTGKRGILFGVKFFYTGNENWDNTIPKIGKGAEKGCFDCGWYDIVEWRKALNKVLSV